MTRTGLLLWAAFVCACTVVQGRDSADLRVVAARSTLTAISITSTTTTVPLTCITAISTATICRKRRRLAGDARPLIPKLRKSPKQELDSSVNNAGGFVVAETDDATSRRGPRLAFTLWTTSTSAFTFTITSTNAALTFAVSFMCTFPGQTFPAACG